MLVSRYVETLVRGGGKLVGVLDNHQLEDAHKGDHDNKQADEQSHEDGGGEVEILEVAVHGEGLWERGLLLLRVCRAHDTSKTTSVGLKRNVR